jgi:hypothetical protein
LYCDHNNLDVGALNTLLTSLPDRTGLSPKGDVYINNNPGTSNMFILSGILAATSKNWEVK